MSTIPVSGRWSISRPGRIQLDIPAVDFTAIVDGGGSHLTITLTGHQAKQAHAILHDLLATSEGNDQ
jgi:hypothetical protein